MSLRIGIVVEAHPEDNSVDVVMTDDYSRLTGVQVLCHNAGASNGLVDLLAPITKSGEDKWNLKNRTTSDQIAAIEFSGPMPIVIGFVYPQIGQMTFQEKNLRINRHFSDVYSMLDSLGNFEMAFPNGTFIRIGSSPDHVDLTVKDFDKQWKIEKNTQAATYLRMVLGNAGNVVADVSIDPSGNVSGTFDGTGNLNFAGNVSLTCPNLTVNAANSVTLDTPSTHITGNTVIDGSLTVHGLLSWLAGMSGSGSSGGGASASITGNVNIVGSTALGDITSNGKDIGSTHTHSGVRAGGDNSGPPV